MRNYLSELKGSEKNRARYNQAMKLLSEINIDSILLQLSERNVVHRLILAIEDPIFRASAQTYYALGYIQARNDIQTLLDEGTEVTRLPDADYQADDFLIKG